MQRATFQVVHEESNPTCGDKITVGLTIEGEKITALGWEGSGCAISQAAMSMLFEELEEMSVTDAQKLQKDDVLELLGVPVSNRRLNCALLGLKAVQKCIE